ncbi:helix-turn-helix domain-containing protein [Sorangium sp. So ce385]|uniref:helix-turn-helix domain-containing protein n=1 Tax=Sorangium sp. So ce385 TaxID=3133308 RepID=UPI003F5BBF80
MPTMLLATPSMTAQLPAKYGVALTGSDWVGLPLRIGHVPESGRFEALSNESDAVLVWTGGPSHVHICFADPTSGEVREHSFERLSGMMDLLPRRTRLHSVEWRGRPSVCTAVNFPEASMLALCSSPSPGLVPERGPQFGLVDAHVVDLVLRLQAQAEGQEYLGAVYVQSLSLALASYLSARYGAGAKAESSLRSTSLSISQRTRIEKFVDSELSSNFGLVDLAGMAGYSPDHFSRLFKHAFRQTPYQYVLSRRIERAMAMLRDERLSIAEIALACGFSNQGHLTTAFKRRTGMTPGAYRKR